MSRPSAEAFLKRMKTDSAFARRVTSCKDQKARAALVKGEGYDFTNDELQSLPELDQAGLEQVVGGVSEGGAAAPIRLDCKGVSYAECC